MNNTAIVDRVSLIPEERWLYAATITVPWKQNNTIDAKRVLREMDIYFRKMVRKTANYNGFEAIGSNHILSLSTLQYRPTDEMLHIHSVYSALWTWKSLQAVAKDGYTNPTETQILQVGCGGLTVLLRSNEVTLYGNPYIPKHCFVKPYEANNNAWTKYITREGSEWYLSSFAMKVIKQRQKQQKKNEQVLKRFERIYNNE